MFTGRLPLVLRLSWGAAVAFRAQTIRVLHLPLPPRGAVRKPPGPCGQQPVARAGRGHMTAQRLRRSAPWNRSAACTCLQRAQPTLLSSSLKSSRMCQLYLAEHST